VSGQPWGTPGAGGLAPGEKYYVSGTVTKLPERQVSGVMRVAVVSEPTPPALANEVLVSGMLLGPFPVRIVQIRTVLPPVVIPRAGSELPVVVDPASDPPHFVVTWGRLVPQGTDTAGAVPSYDGPWDPGPGGAHVRALADWLAAQGFVAEDFGDGLDASSSPGMAALLDDAAARHATPMPAETVRRLKQSGEPVEGEVEAVHPLPMPAQMLPSPQASIAWLTLKVKPSHGGSYQTTIRAGFRSPERFAQLASVGARLPLRRDRTNPRMVAIDSDAFDRGAR
jgi:hypothetical protein